MDFIWCNDCRGHHDKGFHQGAQPVAERANKDVKQSWASRGGFPGTASKFLSRPREARMRSAAVPRSDADASGDPPPAKGKSDRRRGRKQRRRKK